MKALFKVLRIPDIASSYMLFIVMQKNWFSQADIRYVYWETTFWHTSSAIHHAGSIGKKPHV